MTTKNKKKTAAPMFYSLTKEMAHWLRYHASALQVQQRDVVRSCGIGQGGVSAIFTQRAKKVSAKNWGNIYSFLTGKGAPALDPKDDPALTTPDPEAIRTALRTFKDTTKAGWSLVAETCGVNKTTINSLMNGDSTSVETLLLLQKGLRKLNALPKELEKAGLVLPPLPPKQVPAVKKPTLITKVVSPFSEMELDVRELDILARERALLDKMRQYAPLAAKHTNGVRK